jgi:hypothetical protein
LFFPSNFFPRFETSVYSSKAHELDITEYKHLVKRVKKVYGTRAHHFTEFPGSLMPITCHLILESRRKNQEFGSEQSD